ncbi:L10-interacting MYB domain-containing protein [Bienertia sinuspersici]
MAPKKKMPNEDNDCGGRNGSRAMWLKENLYLFCDLCIEFAERSKGKRGSTISQRMPWKVLEVEFQKRTNLAYDKNKLKNKWDWMRSRWSLWKALKGKETGLGWDHEKGTISASEEWWQMKIEENTQFRSFQEEGIETELEYKMEQLFGVSVAQGTLRFTPGQREKESMYISTPLENAPYDYDDEMSENDILNPNQASQQWQEVWNESSLNPSPSPSPQSTEHGITRRGSKRNSEGDAPDSSKSCKTESSKKGGAAMLMDKIDAMVKVITERNTKEMELMNLESSVHDNSSQTLADSLAKLVSLDGLVPGSPEFSFACTLIEDPQKRIILDGMPNDHARLQWIKFLYAKSEKN